MTTERVPDSIIKAEDRAARIRSEARRLEREQARAEAERKRRTVERDEEILRVEDEAIEKVGLISSDETREHLLDRIREMRETGTQEPPPPPPLTERMRQQLEAEQAAGRAAVEKAEAEMEHARAMRERNEAEERARSGFMTPVHHPNPSQDEQFPANKATLKGRV